MSQPDPQEVIAGASEAEALLSVLQSSLTLGDEFFDFLRSMRRDASDDRLRGFCRRLQKALEQAR